MRLALPKTLIYIIMIRKFSQKILLNQKEKRKITNVLHGIAITREKIPFNKNQVCYITPTS